MRKLEILIAPAVCLIALGAMAGCTPSDQDKNEMRAEFNAVRAANQLKEGRENFQKQNDATSQLVLKEMARDMVYFKDEAGICYSVYWKRIYAYRKVEPDIHVSHTSVPCEAVQDQLVGISH